MLWWGNEVVQRIKEKRYAAIWWAWGALEYGNLVGLLRSRGRTSIVRLQCWLKYYSLMNTVILQYYYC